MDTGRLQRSIDEALVSVRASIKAEFSNFFDSLVKNDVLSLDEAGSMTRLYELSDQKSLKSVPNQPGFYVVFSTCKVEGASSKLVLPDGRRAIYRGEGWYVYRRLESHLFNAIYRRDYAQRKGTRAKFSEPYYGACMKLQTSESGINIDQDPYQNEKWAVLVVRLPGSGSLLRKQAELAFDMRFDRPAASREA